MQTTVKHAKGAFVIYVGCGEKAIEYRWPWKWSVFKFRPRAKKKPAAGTAESGPTLPGFEEPAGHAPQHD